jgi:hypothetical protein
MSSFYSSDSYFTRLRLRSGKTTTLMVGTLFVMSLLGGIGIVMISVETTIGETNASTTGTAIQDPGDSVP